MLQVVGRLHYRDPQLILASGYGQVGIVPILLAESEEIDCQAKNGVTAVFLASVPGHEEVVKISLVKGANIDLRENGGRSAVAHSSTKQIKQMLIAAGAAK